MKTPDKYTFIGAVRPFSFPVALVTCSIGLLLAWQQGAFSLMQALLVLAGGVLLQAGVNLINDYSDLSLLRRYSDSEWKVRAVQRHFRLGMACFLLASVIALYFVSVRGMGFLVLCLLGLLGALGYTLKPINYKSRGLGVVLVFWLMGVMMISGSALALGAPMTPALLLQSVPVSLLVALLLLSNELRDFESDSRDGHATLTVRSGYRFSVGAGILAVSIAVGAGAFARRALAVAEFAAGLQAGFPVTGAGGRTSPANAGYGPAAVGLWCALLSGTGRPFAAAVLIPIPEK